MKKSNKFMLILGIDWGEKRIGLALGNSENKIATPYKVVGNVNDVLEIIEEEGIEKIIIGQPLTLKNEQGKMNNKILNFIEYLKKKTDLPIGLVDERLTSRAADQLPGNKKNKAERDAIAAMLILQGYLDRL